VWGTGELQAGFGWGNPKESGHVEDLSIDEIAILKRIFNK
jgi:hypothetical protein